jgi:hypothetical protein
MQRHFWALTVIFSLCVSCARHHDEPPPAIKPTSGQTGTPAVQERSDPGCSTINDTSLDPARVVQRKSVALKLEYQLVSHKDCSGREIKRGIEKVTLPQEEYVLTPAGNNWGDWWKRLGGTDRSTAYNRTSCTDSGSGDTLIKILALPLFLPQIAADGVKDVAGHPRMRFYINTSPTALDMRVIRNRDNYIDYEFSKCESAGSACTKPTSVERGTLILTVNYSENNLTGVKDVSDCQPQPDQGEKN